MATLELVIDGQTFVVEVGDVSRSPVSVVVNGVTRSVSFREAAASPVAPAAPVAAATAAPAAAATAAPAAAATAAAAVPEAPAEPVVETAPVGSVSGEVIVAPMPGKILSVLVTVGQAIQRGDIVCTLEAMKMEMPISATAAGTVKAVHVQVGQTVANDAPLVTIG